ncbi:energy-coupling factor ABC transporter permease [Methanosarcinaceae archaeon]|nr:energy-coupling factor ABC transporter permease [Methanosarcinaceae archaeon]
MHIMEGCLPGPWWQIWTVLSFIVVIYGIYRLNQLVKKNRELLPLLAVAGAFIFVFSCLKLPSVTGSCSHPTGTGLSAIMFGPAITSVVGFIVLLFQALLLAHGGMTTLGANVFSMGIFGPFVGWGLFKILQKAKAPIYLNVFLAAAVADLATYVLTSFEMAIGLSYDVAGGFGDPFMSLMIEQSIGFLSIFAVTQLPLAVIEGLILTVAFKYLVKVKGELIVKLGIIDDEQLQKIRDN